MHSLLDREIESPEKDAFGHRHFANALESLIEAPENSPPFSIGLLGGWRIGKSTIKAIYLNQLKDNINRSKKIHPIIFNAWRFGGENIKRALLRNVFLEIDGDEASLKDALFRYIKKLLPEKRDWRQILRAGVEEWGWCILIFFLMSLIVALFIWLISWKYGLSNNWEKAAIILGMFYIGGEIIKYNLKRLSSYRSSTVTQIEPPYNTIEEYEDLLLSQLKKYKLGKTSSKKGKSCERLVIFVDDLDRLSREEMVNGLDAIRTFMEIPKEKLPEGLGIVFVVSCDEERIAAALARSRQSDMPGAVFTRNDARRFLDRIFQFRLEIPSFPKRDMRNYATRKLNEDLKEIFEDLKQREVSIETLIDRMIHVGVQTPRNALQILNAFAQCWWLASKREFDGAGTEVPGGLQEGAVTGHPYALAALCAIRVDFPYFYEHLQREPELIKRFTNVFIKGEALKDQPESALDILKKYIDDKNKLKPEHNSLRQFISGLQGLHWPPSVQPLLLLTQDPVTRKFGDKGPRLYNALVYGDDFSVLVELGRDKDSKPLTIDEVGILHDMVEDLDHETSVYRDNAAAAIAALSKRLPYDQAHILLSSIAQRLYVSHELRWRLGVKKISDILPYSLPENRKEVAEELIDDLLKMEGDINFKLESGEPPSLDEAFEMAHRACSLALLVREQDGLDKKPDTVLLNWLEIRRVSVNKKEDHLPFSNLEDWMDKYENTLLPALGGRYTKLLADQLEENQIQGLVINNIIRRSQSVFDILVIAGEESRKELWENLSRFVLTKPPELVALAWNFMGLHLKMPDSQELTLFIKNFSQRLIKNMEDSENWGLERDIAGQALLNMIEKRRKDITQEGQEALANLTNSWASVPETAKLATNLLDFLCEMNRKYGDDIISSWIVNIMSDIPEECINWLSRQFITTLNDNQRIQLTNQFNILYQRDNISEGESIKFRQFISQLSEEAIKTASIQKYLGQLFPFIAQRHNNPHDYLYRVFPAIAPIIKNGPPSQTGNMLDTLFNQAGALPKIYGWLHNEMAEFWPLPSGELGPYNPMKIFDQAKNIANQHPNDSSAYGILRSMREMITQGIVNEDKTSDIIEIACSLWPFQQKEALLTFKTFKLAPDLQKLTNLMDLVDPSDDEKKNNLVEAWTYLSKLLNDENLSQATKLILGKPIRGTEPEPDFFLRIWIVVQGKRKKDLLSNLIIAQDINDDQRKRIWLQIEQTYQELGKDFFLNILLKIFEIQDSHETINTILQREDMLGNLFPSKDDRYNLGRVLLKIFFSTQSVDVKNRLINMLKSLGAEDVLTEIKNMGEPSDEDLEILKSHFPKSRHLK